MSIPSVMGIRIQSMDQNSFFINAIDYEAIKSKTNTHHHKGLPGKDIIQKTIQSFLKKTLMNYM